MQDIWFSESLRASAPNLQTLKFLRFKPTIKGDQSHYRKLKVLGNTNYACILDLKLSSSLNNLINGDIIEIGPPKKA